MKFTSILKQLVLEQSRFEILRDALTKPTQTKDGQKQKPKMTVQEFLQLVQADPTTKLNNVDPETANSKELEKIKAGKYVNWLIKSYLNPETERTSQDRGYEEEVKQMKERFMEDLYKVTNDLKKFDRFKSRLDVDKREIQNLTPSSLYELVKDFSLEKTKASKEEKQQASETYQHPGGEIIYRGNSWTVAKITDAGALGKDAACFYGGYYLEPSKGETRWCTSSPGLDWFTRYIKDGPLYVVIPNNWSGKRGEKSGLPAERYQFHFPSNQFMDTADRQIDLVGFLNGQGSELKQVFKPEFAKGLTLGGEKLNIDSFTHGAIGKFIALYGLDDLIKSLPVTLEEFMISNKDEKLKIDIKIPKEISRFKNLRMLFFDNCISEVPEEVCELPLLRFLAVINCPNVKTVPECLVDSPNFYFLNIKGSNNIKVPEKILAAANVMGNGMYDLQKD